MTAAGAHIAVVPEHLEEGWWWGTAFAVVAVVQIVLGAVLVRGSAAWVRISAVAFTAGLVVVYGLSRTAGLPLPHDDHGHDGADAPGAIGDGVPLVHPGPEPVTWPGVVCVVAELVLIAALVRGLDGRCRTAATGACVMLACLGAVLAAVVGSALATPG